MSEMYKKVKIGDEVIEFTYWNSNPRQEVGKVIGITEHFVRVEYKKTFGKETKIISRANIEVITT